jgi:hypothetical protein
VADGTRVTVGIRPQVRDRVRFGEGHHHYVAYFEHCSSSAWRPARSPSMEEGIVVLTAVAESYGPEQPVVMTAPPERVYLFDIDSGEHCDDQALQ